MPLDRELVVSIFLKEATCALLLMATFDVTYVLFCLWPITWLSRQTLESERLGFSLLPFFESLSFSFLIYSVPIVIFMSCL